MPRWSKPSQSASQRKPFVAGARSSTDFVIPNEVRDLQFAQMQIPFLFDVNPFELESRDPRESTAAAKVSAGSVAARSADETR